MPITLLDIIVLGVMLLSGLLAMVRGFMREILSIAAWACAAIVTVSFYARFVPMAKEYIDNEIVATASLDAAGWDRLWEAAKRATEDGPDAFSVDSLPRT